MRLHTGWSKGERDFSEKEFKNSWIKKSYGSKLSYDKYLEARIRMKLNEKRRRKYALKKKLNSTERKINNLLGDIF